LAGLIIEVSGKIPQKNEKVSFHQFSFIVEASDKRRVKRVKLIIHQQSMRYFRKIAVVFIDNPSFSHAKANLLRQNLRVILELIYPKKNTN
jgi:hypothetical protein